MWHKGNAYQRHAVKGGLYLLPLNIRFLGRDWSTCLWRLSLASQYYEYSLRAGLGRHEIRYPSTSNISKCRPSKTRTCRFLTPCDITDILTAQGARRAFTNGTVKIGALLEALCMKPDRGCVLGRSRQEQTRSKLYRSITWAESAQQLSAIHHSYLRGQID